MSQSGKGVLSGILGAIGLGKKRRKRRTRTQKGKGILDILNNVAKATKIGSTVVVSELPASNLVVPEKLNIKLAYKHFAKVSALKSIR
jgi:hypothetical protein